MKNLTFFLFLFVCATQVMAQTTGINTLEPKATLDVAGHPGNATVFDGIIPPRISGDQLSTKTYTSEQTGAMVYVTVAATSPAGQTIHVTSSGYYFFDGIIWKQVGVENPVSADNGLTKTNDNIQLGGTLSKDTDVNRAGFNTTFSGTGNFGIGTDNPQDPLDVRGLVRMPEVAVTSVVGPFDALGINTNTGRLGTFTPAAIPSFVRKVTSAQIVAGNPVKLALHNSNTFINNTLGIVQSNNNLEVTSDGLFKIDLTIIGRRANVGSRVAVVLNVFVNNTLSTKTGFVAAGIEEFSSFHIPLVIQLNSGDQFYLELEKVSGNSDFEIAPGTGGDFSQQIIITKF